VKKIYVFFKMYNVYLPAGARADTLAHTDIQEQVMQSEPLGSIKICGCKGSVCSIGILYDLPFLYRRRNIEQRTGNCSGIRVHAIYFFFEGLFSAASQFHLEAA
jgi:hypothetical protein